MRIAQRVVDLLRDNQNSQGFSNNADEYGLNLYVDHDTFEALNQGKGEELALTQLIHLKMLEEEGLAERIANGFSIESDAAVRLEPDLRVLFELPDYWPGSLELLTEAQTASPSYRLSWRLHTADGKAINHYNFEGPILKISENEKYLPTPAQWLALKTVDDHQSLADRNRSEYQNLLAIHKIQQAANEGCDADLRHFEKLKTVMPDSVTANVTVDESGDLHITPGYGTNLSADEIAARLGQITPDNDAVQSLRVGETIVLLDEDKFKATQEIIRNRRIPAKLAKQFFASPTSFLDATLVDLDVGFSVRVQGITEFRHAYFGETEESGIDWFDKLNKLGKTTILGPGSLDKVIGNIDELEQFRDMLTDARKTGTDVVEFNGHQIDIQDPEAIDAGLSELEESLRTQELDESKGGEREGADSQDEEEDPAPSVVDTIQNDDEQEIVSTLANLAESEHRYKGDLCWEGYLRKPYRHQEDGVRWILGLAEKVLDKADEESLFGGLLADDMGLGKTFMSLSAISEFYRQCDARELTCKPVLVVAPLSLLVNWREEVEQTFASSPFTDVITLHGDADMNRFRLSGQGIEIRNQDLDANPDSVMLSLKIGPDFGAERLDQPRRLVLVNYDTLANYQFSLCRIDWSFAIFDEAQNIKNPNTLQARAAKGLKAQFRLMVTGTPVENSLTDLWSLMDTAVPGLLGEYQGFRKEYVLPLMRAGDDLADVRKKIGEELRSKVGSLMLRRLKEDSLDGLPDKTIFTGVEMGDERVRYLPELACAMTELQAGVYDAVIEATQSEMADADKSGSPVLVGLKRLRDVSLHPDLLTRAELPMHCHARDCATEIEKSGKLSAVVKLLEDIQQRGEKVLIFITSRRLQAFLSHAFSKIFEVPVEVINGQTKAVAKRKDARTRRRIIAVFESTPGFGMLIMSPIAAGVGLTITGANNVIHLERHWNPAKEDQATDRVYRIGQERDVNVYVPILHHPERESFDLNLHRLLSRKIDLKDAVVTTDAIRPDELAGAGVFGGSGAHTESWLSGRDLDGISWDMFEALVAELVALEYQGDAQLTRKGNDKGCDVVLRSPETNMLIQCKSTTGKRLRGDGYVREIQAAQAFYKNGLNMAFPKMAVFTNAKSYARDGKKAAKLYGVELYDRSWLTRRLEKHSVSSAALMRRLDRSRLEV